MTEHHVDHQDVSKGDSSFRDRRTANFAAGVGDFTVDGCMVGAVGTFTCVSKNVQAWGIEVAEGIGDGYIITNNRAISNLAGGIHDGGAGKNKTVSGNITRP
jgi:hypothetical protein